MFFHLHYRALHEHGKNTVPSDALNRVSNGHLISFIGGLNNKPFGLSYGHFTFITTFTSEWCPYLTFR